MNEFGVYGERLAQSGLRVFERAVEESRRRQQNYVSLGHILKALGAEESTLFNRMLDDLYVEPPLTEEFLDMVIGGSPSHEGAGLRISPQVIWLFRHAMKVARGEGRERIEAADLLLGFVRGVQAGAPWMGEREGRRIGLAIVPANHPHFFVLRLKPPSSGGAV